jgi:aspartate-semialdehyde dehydrogenase
VNPIEVGLLGATGSVGQQFALQLRAHPWFRLTWLGASDRSAGRRYGELPWRLAAPMPDGLRDLVVEACRPGRAPRLLFSALDAAAAGEIEAAFAQAGHVVVSNARTYRMQPLVPLLVPEINPEHLGLLPAQRRANGWRGAIVTNPNCSTVFLAMALAALRPLGPAKAVVTTLQAASGAGYPGVASLDLLGNVIPFIAGEEEKIENETRKILGRLDGEAVTPHPIVISAQTTRVPVVHGHTETLAVAFAEDEAPPREALLDAFSGFAGAPQERGLPSAPPRPVVYLDEEDRPQPRLDAERAGGMAVFVGRLRPCPVLHWKFVLLGHNTVRGAAGAAVLNAELMAAGGWLD